MQVANMGDLPLERIDDFLLAVRDVIAELRRETVPRDPAAVAVRVRATA